MKRTSSKGPVTDSGERKSRKADRSNGVKGTGSRTQSQRVARYVRDLRTALRRAGSPARAVGAKAYLKSSLEFYGVASPALYAIVRGFLADHPTLSAGEVRALVRALWRIRNHEVRSAAVMLLDRRRTILDRRDLPMLERWLRESRSWAYVDWIATHLVAAILARDPGVIPTLRRWAADDDFWIRRSALLALLPSLRRGGGGFDFFVTLADPMVIEPEFFIRKALGWVLREVGKSRPDLTSAFLARHVSTASGVTWREAIKYLPRAERARLSSLRDAAVRTNQG